MLDNSLSLALQKSTRRLRSTAALYSLFLVLIGMVLFYIVFHYQDNIASQSSHQASIQLQKKLLQRENLLLNAAQVKTLGELSPIIMDLTRNQQTIDNISRSTNSSININASELSAMQKTMIDIKAALSGNDFLRVVQLKKLAHGQVNQLNTVLEQTVVEHDKQVAQLYQKTIANDKDRQISALLANTYFDALLVQETLKDLITLFRASEDIITSLSIQTDYKSIDQLNKQLLSAITHWQNFYSSHKTALFNNADQQMALANQILFTEQKYLLLWQDYLQEIIPLFKNIAAQKQFVNHLRLQQPEEIPQRKLLPLWLTSQLSELGVSLSHQHGILIAIAIFVLITLTLLMRLLSLVKPLHRLSNELEYIDKEISDKAKDKDNVSEEPVESAQPQQSFLDEEWQQFLVKEQVGVAEQQLMYKKLACLYQQAQQKIAEQQSQQVNGEGRLFAQIHTQLLDILIDYQSTSFASGVTLPKVYSQVDQMLRYCEQRILLESIQDKAKISLSDPVEFSDIQTVMLNVMNKAHMMRNKVFFNYDGQIKPRLQGHKDVFFLALEYLAQMMLVQQSRAILQINMVEQHIDGNDDELVITFTVFPDSGFAKIPKVIADFIDNQNLEQLPAIAQYASALCSSLSIDHSVVGGCKKSYFLTVHLPVTFTESKTEALTKVDFRHARIAVLSHCNVSANWLSNCLEQANADCYRFDTVENLQTELNRHNQEKLFDVVVLLPDSYRSHLVDVKKSISVLSLFLQPKLFVMQSPFERNLQDFGLFDQVNMSLSGLAIQQNLNKLLIGESTDNTIVNAENFPETKAISSHIDVLIACENPEKSQSWQRLLHWLGLKSFVVCNEEHMQQRWQSGRYSILLTQFITASVMNIARQHEIARAIFVFEKQQLQNIDINTETSITVDILPSLTDIAAILAMFSPWFKHESNNKIKTLTTVKTDKPLECSLESANDVLGEVIDLDKYVLNQGSIDLAVLMLDDYLAQLNSAFTALAAAQESQDTQNLIVQATQIRKISAILAAKPLHHQANMLLQALDHLASADHHLLVQSMLEQYQQLNDYCEQI